LLRLIGNFAHLQMLIDDVLAKNFFERRIPKAAEFLMERVVSRIRDSERTKLVRAIADEFNSPAELDNFNQVYMDVKRIRDKLGHSVILSEADGVLCIIDSYSATKRVGDVAAGSMATGTIERSQIDEAVHQCRWLEAQIYLHPVFDRFGSCDSAGWSPVKVVKPPRKFSDWDGCLALEDDGPYQ
jgi:hypothetical protein